MRKRAIIISLAILLISVGTCVLWPTKPEPSYRGRRLSEWLPGYNATATANELARTEEAIRHIGTNGLPFLLEWINYEEASLKAELRGSFNHLQRKMAGNKLFLGDAKRVRADQAAHALATLGPEAKGAIPVLSRMMNDEEAEHRGARATYALGHMGAYGLPPLLLALTNTNIEALGARLHAAGAMPFLGTNALPALPALIECLADQGPFGVEYSAARALGELRLEPERVVPVLVACVNGTNVGLRLEAVNALAKLGPGARPAVPALLTALTNSWFTLRKDATNALLRIAPELLTNAPRR